MVRSREWRLIRRPRGRPVDDDVELVEVELDGPADGQVLVQNLVMSVEPYMRGRMDEGAYATPYTLGQPMHGRAVGRVVASATDDIHAGTLLLTQAGWREYGIVDASDARGLTDLGLPPSVHLGMLGTTGMSAWVGLERIAGLQDGDAVFVNSAAGAVGSAVAQLARHRGCTVVGSAGSPRKVAFLRDELRVDAAFDYHDGTARDLLANAAEEAGVDGFDVLFDNVGGEQLEAAIDWLRRHASIVLCGMISQYNLERPEPGPDNLLKLIWQRATMSGMRVSDHEDLRPEFEAAVVPLLASGTIVNHETVIDGGLEAAFHAFLGMLDGDGIGKTVVPLAT